MDDLVVVNPPGIAASDWVTGLDAPWSLVFLPDGRALVSERPGLVRLVERGRLRAAPIAAIESVQGGEGGLMGLALHPRFESEPFVYAMHTADVAGERRNRVIRLRLAGETLTFDRVVFQGIAAARFHNGGRIGFGPDGLLYIGTGEIFQAERAQDIQDMGGKILRLTPEGAVPAENPFSGSPVYSLGHRNVQGLAWHPDNGQLFISEHGPSGEFGLRAHDEINVGARGGNFGWPRVVGAPGDPQFVDPLVAWPTRTTPPSGMAFWRGDLYVATLRSEALVRIRFAALRDGSYRTIGIERWFAERFGRLRDAVTGPDGALYVVTNNTDGRGTPRTGDDRILRIEARP
ncbi:MAG: PQQ-dependent sugar dehydrogenase [Alphaproteobacteria bacterium]|nr:PQQ-dependent sugar dehydrogenase [Alphaproteobacteria bacterium]